MKNRNDTFFISRSFSVYKLICIKVSTTLVMKITKSRKNFETSNKNKRKKVNK